MREYAIKDNIGFGQDDFDILADEWNQDELNDWGMELPDFNVEEEPNEDEYESKDLQFVVEVVCKDEQEQNSVFSELDAKGYEVRLKMK